MDQPSHHEESIRGSIKPGRALKPVIKELVRTEVHPPLLELLVDKILIVSNVKAKGRNTEAFRIWLSDGQNSIQGKWAHRNSSRLRHRLQDVLFAEKLLY